MSRGQDQLKKWMGQVSPPVLLPRNWSSFFQKLDQPLAVTSVAWLKGLRR